MIISVSRRSDIPAFYTEWFLKRLKEKYVIVKNPFNTAQASSVDLSVEAVDALVFWTRNPAPLMKYLSEIEAYTYYFLFTLNNYPSAFEPMLPGLEHSVTTFQRLAKDIGPEKVIWRYDPVILSPETGLEFHMRNFSSLVSRLSGSTKKCIISFGTMYKKNIRNFREKKIRLANHEEINILATSFQKDASANGISLQCCSSRPEQQTAIIPPGSCVDVELIEHIGRKKINIGQKNNQRQYCLCAPSKDIGAYNTCPHGCVYCYANSSQHRARMNFNRHNPDSPCL